MGEEGLFSSVDSLFLVEKKKDWDDSSLPYIRTSPSTTPHVSPIVSKRAVVFLSKGHTPLLPLSPCVGGLLDLELTTLERGVRL